MWYGGGVGRGVAMVAAAVFFVCSVHLSAMQIGNVCKNDKEQNDERKLRKRDRRGRLDGDGKTTRSAFLMFSECNESPYLSDRLRLHKP